jgi:hypothetical protein
MPLLIPQYTGKTNGEKKKKEALYWGNRAILVSMLDSSILPSILCFGDCFVFVLFINIFVTRIENMKFNRHWSYFFDK